MNLKGKAGLVTGGGRGIGRSIALMLGQAGARVVVAARTAKEIEATAKMIRDAGGEALPIAADVTKEHDVDRLFCAIAEQVGPLDILINNAGAGIYGEI
jgi:NAD(P)-dependent dehydrogenase (short-subunit alcohol dehydrogenase family)